MPLSDSIKAPLAFAFSYPRLLLWDAMHNRRYVARDEKKFLVARYPARNPFFYDAYLNWLALYFPEARARFELCSLPVFKSDWSSCALHIPWLQDPVQQWSPFAYGLANKLAAQCDAKGIPVINRVDRLANAGKAEGARRIASAGLRVPAMARITDAAEFRRTKLGLKLPLFIREDWGHGGEVYRADSEEELKSLPVEKLARAVAIEIVDVQSHDGYFRKYRYTVAGTVGVRQSMHACEQWRACGTKTAYSDKLRDEEIAFIDSPEPQHEKFVAACKALGLDFAAFDYSFAKDNSVIVWEANPYPFLHLAGSARRNYRHAPTVRVFAAMTKLYYERAGLKLPEGIAALP